MQYKKILLLSFARNLKKNLNVKVCVTLLYGSTITLCLKKNDNDVLRYNFNAHQPILIIFGRDIAE